MRMIDEVGGQEISTIKLDMWVFAPYETCVFYPNGDSEVVAMYGTEDEARAGHEALVDKTKRRLAAVISLLTEE